MTPGPMHDSEVGIDRARVRRLLARQFPAWADLALEPVPSAGTDNALFRLGAHLVVRLPRIHWAVDDVAKEQRWLPLLAPHLPVAIPVPLARGEPGEDYPYPWSVYGWLEGDNPRVGAVADPVALARDVAAFVAALQRIDVAGAPRASRGGTLIERDASTRAAIAELGGSIDARAVHAAWESALAVAPWARAPVWIHGDLAPGNLLCRGGRLSAVIDFGGLGVGDPAVDLLIAWTLLPSAGREALREALRVDDATWRRGRGWALSIALIQLPYYRTTNPALAASARHVLREVLAEAATEA